MSRRTMALLAVVLLVASACAPTPSPSPEGTPISPAATTVSVAPVGPQATLRLPIAAGHSIVVTNGNMGVADHAPGQAGQYAWDFGENGNVPFTVVAAIGGTVLGSRSDSAISCSSLNTAADGSVFPDCWAQANYVLVDDGDGRTASLYMHLAPNTVTVKAGSVVCQGQPLGIDGRTGWANGIHLHFQIERRPSAGAGVGWWFTPSIRATFADPDVLRQQSSGVPVTGGSYLSANSSTGQCIPSTTHAPQSQVPTPIPTPRPTSSPTWSRPTIIGVSGLCSSVVAGIDAAGRYHVVAGCDRGIVYSIKAPGGSWATSTLAPPANRTEVGPQIAFEGSTEYLGYTITAPGEGCGGGYDDLGVYYRTRTLPNGAWSAASRIGVANDQLDSFRESGGEIYATVENSAYDTPGFAVETKMGTIQHEYPVRDALGPISMRVGTDGRAQLVYASNAGISFGVFAGSQLSTTTAFRDTSGYAYAPVLVLDGANKAHFLLTYGPHGGCAGAGGSSKDGTYYATDASGSWTSTRISKFVGETSLQFDNGSGRIHALVTGFTDNGEDTGGLVYLTAPSGGSWSSTKLTSLLVASPVIRLEQTTGALLVAFLGPNGIYVLTRP